MPTVLVTRPREAGSGLERALETHGIECVSVPTVAIDLDGAAAGLDGAVSSLDGAAWLVITSANGAGALARSLRRTRRQLPSETRVAAVGPATADALRSNGVRVDHIPSKFVTAPIAAGLGDVAARRVVLARADRATRDLRDELERRGAIVEEVVAYRTIEGPATARDTLHAALQRDLDGVAFTSGSTVRGLLALASATDRARARALRAFCIGPVTAEVARGHGLHVAGVADPHTAEGLATAIAARLGVPSA